MFHWLLLVLAGCLARQNAALVAMPNQEHFAVHEAGRRTALHHRGSVVATVDVGSLGEVGLNAHQNPGGITGIVDDTVYGNLMLITLTPQKFAKSSAARTAAQKGVEELISAWKLEVREVTASLTWLEDFPQAVLVGFQVTFLTPKARQTFTWRVATDGARKLAQAICDGVPGQYAGRCELPKANQLGHVSLADLELDESSAVVAPVTPNCHGAVFLKPDGQPETSAQNPQWQEAVAMAISNVATVSRLQVGTLLAVVADAVRVDYWFTQGDGNCSQATIDRVKGHSSYISHLAAEQLRGWELNRRDVIKDFPVSGHIMLQVPSPQAFVGNTSALGVVRLAVAQVAARSGLEGTKLSVTNATASLATVGSTSNTVQVGFRVTFAIARDRQVFAWDFAQDWGEKLAKRINEQIRACEGRCWLPGQHLGKAAAKLGQEYSSWATWAPRPRDFASDPLVPVAMALVISKMASVPYEQVGILLMPDYRRKVTIDYWVTSSNATLREATMRQAKRDRRSKFLPCTVAELDRLYNQTVSKDPTTVVGGNIALHVPDGPQFAKSGRVRLALRDALMQMAVPVKQVQQLKVLANQSWQFPQLVRVDFRVAVSTQERGEGFARSVASDGGEKLAQLINELVDKPFKAVRLAVLDHAKATVGNSTILNSSAINATVAMRPASTGVAGNSTQNASTVRRYGTMLIYLFDPDFYANEALRQAALAIIAEVASVSRQQVGIITTVKSPVLLSIDFWVISSNATLQQAALRRVNTQWNSSHLNLLRERAGYDGNRPMFMVSGGTIFKGLERFNCEQTRG